MPDIKELMLNNSSQTRQSWREQMTIMSEWAAKHNLWLEQKRKMTDGR